MGFSRIPGILPRCPSWPVFSYLVRLSSAKRAPVVSSWAQLLVDNYVATRLKSLMRTPTSRMQSRVKSKNPGKSHEKVHVGTPTCMIFFISGVFLSYDQVRRCPFPQIRRSLHRVAIVFCISAHDRIILPYKVRLKTEFRASNRAYDG